MIRVALIAPQMALRMGLREMIRQLPNVQLADEIVSMDVDVMIVTSLEHLPASEQARQPILLLSDDPEAASALQALPIWGLLPLDVGPDELQAAIGALSQGLWVATPAALTSLLRPRSANPGLHPSSLTAREQEVLQCMAQGFANKQIATRLGISEHTVKFHLSSLYAKLHVASRTEAIRVGVQYGWITL